MFAFDGKQHKAYELKSITCITLEIMHRSHTCHDYCEAWVSLTWLLFNLQLDYVTGADFANLLYAFDQ